MNNSKELWKSKTFWVNLIALVIFIVQIFWVPDFTIPLEIQGALLAVINFVLRLITKEEIVWSTKAKK